MCLTIAPHQCMYSQQMSLRRVVWYFFLRHGHSLHVYWRPPFLVASLVPPPFPPLNLHASHFSCSRPWYLDLSLTDACIPATIFSLSSFVLQLCHHLTPSWIHLLTRSSGICDAAWQPITKLEMAHAHQWRNSKHDIQNGSSIFSRNAFSTTP